MLQKIMITLLILGLSLTGLISCCSVARQTRVVEAQTIVKEVVEMGDNIFEAKKKLEAKGLRIMADGPNFATEDKSYYSMVIDYGLSPTAWDTFKYTVELPPSKNEKPIYGLIEADKNGKIYKIE